MKQDSNIHVKPYSADEVARRTFEMTYKDAVGLSTAAVAVLFAIFLREHPEFENAFPEFEKGLEETKACLVAFEKDLKAGKVTVCINMLGAMARLQKLREYDLSFPLK